MTKFAELNALANHIVSLIDTNQQDSGVFKNTRWRMSGVASGVDMDGFLELANAERFDRWANSTTITINLYNIICWETGVLRDNEVEMVDIVKRVFAIYG